MMIYEIYSVVCEAAADRDMLMKKRRACRIK